MTPDVPEQYKQLVDRRTLEIADAADALWCIVGELGCDRYGCEGDLAKVVVTAVGTKEESSNNLHHTHTAITLCQDMLEAMNKLMLSVENVNVFKMRLKSIIAQQQ